MPRRRGWQDFIISESTADGTQDTQLLLGAEVDDPKGLTVVRMVIGLSIVPAPPDVQSPLAVMRVSMGIGIISQEAALVAAYPDPNIDEDVPVTGWMWRWNGLVPEVATVPVRIDLDIRSQRKLMYGSPYFIMNSNLDQETAFTVNTYGLIRVLYLYP